MLRPRRLVGQAADDDVQLVHLQRLEELRLRRAHPLDPCPELPCELGDECPFQPAGAAVGGERRPRSPLEDPDAHRAAAHTVERALRVPWEVAAAGRDGEDEEGGC